MSMLRSFVAASVALVLLAGGLWAADPAKKAVKKGQAVQGTVSAVEQDKDKTAGSVKVKVAAGKKQAAPAEAVEKKFTISKETKFEKLSGKKADIQRTPATFADVKEGDVLVITLKGTEGTAAEKVEIRAGKKKAK